MAAILQQFQIGRDWDQASHCCAAMRSASAASAGVLTLKKGSTGLAGQSAMATPWRAVQASILCKPSPTSALRRSRRNATGHNPATGWRHSPERAQASGAPAVRRAAESRATRSLGRNGQSPGTLTTSAMSGACAAAQSSPARMPASGPAKSGTSSATTGRPVSAKRAGSPLALMIMAEHCGARRVSTRSRMVLPPMRMRALSPPPMRRASPPASTRPSGRSVVMHRSLAPVLRALLLDIGEVLVEHDALLAGERDEALAAGAADQREVGLARELDAPGGEARARHQDRNAHAHGLDYHLRREAPGGVENLVACGHVMLEHEARDLVDGVVAADVLHVDQRLVLLRQHAAVDGAGLEVERGRSVDLVGERVKPRGAQLGPRQRDVLQRLHQVAEHRALGAARGLHLLLQLLLVIGLALGPYHDDGQLLVLVDAGDDVVRQQHVLVKQVADREIFRIVVDRHRCDDLLRIEEHRERALDRHPGLDLLPGLVDPGDALGQPRVERVGADQVVVLRCGHATIM